MNNRPISSRHIGNNLVSTAAPIDSSETMEKRVFNWAKSKINLLLEGQSMGEVGKIPIDVSDTKQYKSAGIKKYLEKGNHLFSVLRTHMSWAPTNSGAYLFDEKVGPVLYLEVADDDFKQLQDTIAHELVHLMQSIITAAAQDRSPGKDFKAGLPGNYNPETYQTYTEEELAERSNDLSYTGHAGSDVEFYSRLSDSRRTLNDYLQMFLEVQGELPVEEKQQTARQFFEDFIEMDPTLVAYRQVDSDKFQKAIKFLYQDFQNIVSRANARLFSKRAKVTSDTPAYKKKEKSDSGGTIYRYDEKHIEKRWKEKKEKLKKLDKDIQKVRQQYQSDLTSDDPRTRAIAAIVGIMDDTAMRIGNEDSAKEGTFGASTLKVKHVKGGSGNMTFDFPGKGAVEQNVVLKNNKVIKVIHDLMKGKKADEFIFEIEGHKIWDRAVNRYLKPMGISAKDLRGFHANRLMKEMLKKKEWKKALEEVAEIVGHKASTLKNQYLDPELVEKHEGKEKKAAISIRAKQYEQIQQEDLGGPELESRPAESDMEKPIGTPPVNNQPVDLNKNVSNIRSKVSPGGFEQVKLTPQVVTAWKILAPFLPDGAELSSGFRSEQDQANTIIGFWRRKWNGYFAKNFPDRGRTVEDMHKFMTEDYARIYPKNRPPGGPTVVFIAAPGESNHQDGNAMDVHKVNFEQAKVAALWLNSVLGDFISLTPLKEGDQNNIHFTINKATYPGPENMTRALQMWNYGSKKPDLYVSQSFTPPLSKRAELTPRDMAWVGNLKGKSQPADIPRGAKRSMSIKPGVKLNQLLLNAWKTLQPFLPAGAVMTSGARTPEDQKQILKNYWRKATGQNIPAHLQSDERVWRQVSRLLKQDYGFIVGPPTTKSTYGHLKGNAFDISGADLGQIASAVRRVSQDDRLPVIFRRPLIESKNNAVHVGIQEAQYDENAIAQVLGESDFRRASVKYLSKRAKDESVDEEELLEDLLESDPPEEILEAFAAEEGYDWVELLEGGDHDLGAPLNELKKWEEDDETWFEKAPMFVHQDEEKDDDYEIDNIDASDAATLAAEDPKRFFYLGLHRRFSGLERVALDNILPEDAGFYFKFEYYKREEEPFTEMLSRAAEFLAQQNPRGFFYYHLHHKFPELGRGAIMQLIDTNPDSFFDLGLDKDYPEYTSGAGDARNIKDPNKVELEQPEWLKVEAAVNFSKEDLEKVYELEYAIHYLSQAGKGNDPYTRHLSSELRKLLMSKGLPALAKAFDEWLDRHDKNFQFELNSLVEGYANVPEYENIPPEIMYDILKDKHMGHPLRMAIVEMRDKLRAGAGDLKSALVLFHEALTTAHHTGQMVEHLPDEDIDMKLLEDLSNSEQSGYQRKWDKALRWAAKQSPALSSRAGDVLYLSGIPDDLYRSLSELPGGMTSTQSGLVVGWIDIFPATEVLWKFYDKSDKNMGETTSRGYTAEVTAKDSERDSPVMSQYYTVWRETDTDPYALFKKLSEYLGDPELGTKILDQIEVPEQPEPPMAEVIPLFGDKNKLSSRVRTKEELSCRATKPAISCREKSANKKG